jgi:hypothetical protein
MRFYSDRLTCDVLLDGFFWIVKDSNDLFLLAKDSSDEPDEGGETTGIASTLTSNNWILASNPTQSTQENTFARFCLASTTQRLII